MPISLPYEQLTERAFSLIDAGHSLEGAYALYDAWMTGSHQADLIFTNNATIDTAQFAPMACSLNLIAQDNKTQFKLALCYLGGIGVERSIDKTHSLLSALHAKQIGEATFLLGWMLIENLYGSNLSPSYRDEQAVDLLTQAIDAGNISAINSLGWMYQHKRVHSELSPATCDLKAVELFSKAAQAGDMLARTNLAFMYASNQTGLSLSPKERDKVAVDLLFQAAQAECIIAKRYLANMYDADRAGLSLSDTQRCETAASLYTQAAKAGCMAAQNNLGEMYLLNRAGLLLSPTQRDEQACKLFTQASQAGYNIARYNLASMYMINRAELRLSQKQRDEKAAVLFTQALQSGYKRAANNLAWMYMHKRACLTLSESERVKIMVRLFHEAIAGGVAAAAWNLAFFYNDALNTNFAIKFFTIAASLYTKTTDITECQGKISPFDDCFIKQYALATIITLLEKNSSLQLHLLGQFSKPSEYLLFYDNDKRVLSSHSNFEAILYERLLQFVKESREYDALEKIALTQLIIGHLSMLCKSDALLHPLSLSKHLITLEVLIDSIIQQRLDYYLPLIEDDATQKAFVDITSTLLAITLMEPHENRKLALKFLALIARLPVTAAIFSESNLQRLCCALISLSKITPPRIERPLTATQLQVVVMHILQSPTIIEQGLDEDALVDEIGIRLMGGYGFKFLDEAAIRLQAQTLLTNPRPASPIAALQSLHQSPTPRLNPWLRKVEEIADAPLGHEMFIKLIQLQQMLQSSPAPKAALQADLEQFLVHCGIKNTISIHQSEATLSLSL